MDTLNSDSIAGPNGCVFFYRTPEMLGFPFGFPLSNKKGYPQKRHANRSLHGEPNADGRFCNIGTHRQRRAFGKHGSQSKVFWG